jgi:hypothetical protein
MTTDYLFDFPNATSGIDSVAAQTVTAVPGFVPSLLVFIFMVVFIGGTVRQKARTGTADYAMWATVGGISQFMVALLFSVSSGFIALEWLVVSFVVTIFCAVWLFISEKQGEI